jgi:hypothetical protein
MKKTECNHPGIQTSAGQSTTIVEGKCEICGESIGRTPDSQLDEVTSELGECFDCWADTGGSFDVDKAEKILRREKAKSYGQGFIAGKQQVIAEVNSIWKELMNQLIDINEAYRKLSKISSQPEEESNED